MNAIVLHSADSALQRVDRRNLQRGSFGRARRNVTADPLSPDRDSTNQAVSRQHVSVRRRPQEETLDPPRDTGDPRTQLYVEHEHLPTPWASWRFINFLI
ncbi:MAG: hypothetical protein JXM70_14035 [Pirellulales bacterium]|nr:hypothetical protein [Pirellulales bacterium]